MRDNLKVLLTQLYNIGIRYVGTYLQPQTFVNLYGISGKEEQNIYNLVGSLTDQRFCDIPRNEERLYEIYNLEQLIGKLS